MNKKIEALIESYYLRLKAADSIEKHHGKEKASGILFELINVIIDLKTLLNSCQYRPVKTETEIETVSNKQQTNQ